MTCFCEISESVTVALGSMKSTWWMTVQVNSVFWRIEDTTMIDWLIDWSTGGTELLVNNHSLLHKLHQMSGSNLHIAVTVCHSKYAISKLALHECHR